MTESIRSRTFDSNWEEWQVGDMIVWEVDKERQAYKITRISQGYVYWDDPETGEENMTRETNLLRVKEKDSCH